MPAPPRVPFPVIGLSAGLLALSFPLADSGPLSGPLGWCAVVAYAPLLVWSVERRAAVSTGHVFAVTLLVHLLAYAVSFHWVAFHPNPTTVAASVGGVLILAVLASAPLALAFATARLGGSRWLLSVWIALALGLEHLLSVGPWALPWPVLSMTQAALPHAGISRWIGAPGLTALVLLTNATVAALLLWSRHGLRQPHAERGTSRRIYRPSNTSRFIEKPPWRLRCAGIGLGLTFMLTPFLPLPSDGPFSSGSATSDAARPHLLIVQPGIDSVTWARTDTSAMGHLIRQTTAALSTKAVEPSSGESRRKATPNAIIWPETALSVGLFAITDYRSSFREFVRSLPSPLLTGAILETPRSDNSEPGSFFRNSALWFNPRLVDTSVSTSAFPADYLDSTTVYAKHHLVPFAERVPFAGSLPVLQRLSVPSGSVATSGGVAGYIPGPGPTVFRPAVDSLGATFATESPDRNLTLQIVPLICFETIIGPYARAGSRQIAKPLTDAPAVLVGISHVGWWGDTALLPQYRALTSLRALETGLPVIVATVRAPSFTARPDGSVILHTRWMQRTTRLVPVPNAAPAPFSLWAPWLNVVTVILPVIIVLILSPIED